MEKAESVEIPNGIIISRDRTYNQTEEARLFRAGAKFTRGRCQVTNREK